MAFRMKVEALFRIGGKTVFAGALDTTEKSIAKARCILQVDGREVDALEIDGEVMSGTGHRDLWTRSTVKLDNDVPKSHEVWLIGS